MAMLKSFWQKLRQNHLLLMVIGCLLPVVLIIGLLSLFKKTNDYWFWLIILLCPLTHIFMMRGHKHNHHNAGSNLYRCPECGLEYQEKERAEKCEAWCKKYKSCNLEITKYAIKRSKN